MTVRCQSGRQYAMLAADVQVPPVSLRCCMSSTGSNGGLKVSTSAIWASDGLDGSRKKLVEDGSWLSIM